LLVPERHVIPESNPQAADSGAAVRVQVVLYENDRDQVIQMVHGLAASSRLAARTCAGPVDLAIGDCSAEPVLPTGTAELPEHPGLRSSSYVHFDENVGFGRAHNLLMVDDAAQFVLFLNPDAYPSPQLLAALVRTMSEPQVALADARQIPFEHPKEFDPLSGDTSWASGACAIVSADVFREVGGFDSDSFFLYCEDVDLSWRVRLAGHRVVHAVDAVVFHDKRVGSNDGAVLPTPFETYNSTLSRLILAHKYGRPDIVAETSSWIRGHGSDPHRQALHDYIARAGHGRLPEPLERAGEVAEFVNGEYARHRF
jgi:GT2 family glycosyltransferase